MSGIDMVERSKSIGGSDISAIVGKDRWKSPYDVWLEKMTGESVSEGNIYSDMGNYLEPLIGEYYAKESGNPVTTPPEKTKFHTADNLFSGSADKYIEYPDNSQGILECKSTSRNIEVGSYEDQWMLQLQWYLGISGIQRGAIAVLKYGYGVTFWYVEVEFNQEVFDGLIKAGREFYETYIVTGTPPAYTNLDIPKFSSDAGAMGTVLATDELQDKIMKIKELEAQIKPTQELIEEYKGNIKVALAEDDILTDNTGKVLATYKMSGKSRRLNIKSN